MDPEYKVRCLIDFLNEGNEFKKFGHLKTIESIEEINEDVLYISRDLEVVFYPEGRVKENLGKLVFAVNGAYFKINYSNEKKQFVYEKKVPREFEYLDLESVCIGELFEI
ncbi:hypothetical protein KY334_04140 [Candidatus Woesearchaeota archaeon]|nr:hypothetical protein [Candidatus Woesearchaeota archaeon]